MAKIRHYRANTLVEAPRNWKELEFEWTWEVNKQEVCRSRSNRNKKANFERFNRWCRSF